MREVGSGEPSDGERRLGLALVATAMLSAAGSRMVLEGDEVRFAEVALAFALALTLVVLAAPRRVPRWSEALAFAVAAAAALSDAALARPEWGLLGVALLAAIALLARPVDRPLAVGAAALLVTAWRGGLLAAETGGTLALPLAAVLAAAFLAGSLRRVSAPGASAILPYAVLGVAIVAAVAQRHVLVASRGLAPDDVVALLAIPALAAVAFVRTPGARAAAVGLALTAYALAGGIMLLTRPYGADAVVAPHRAAELLLEGKNPYRAFDMREALARFGLSPEFATHLEDGAELRSLNYPAGSFLAVAPFVAAGLADIRWLFLGEMLALAFVLLVRAREEIRIAALALVVGNVAALRQFVLAGTDPLWVLGVAVAWLFLERAWLSPIALGLAASARQLAWIVAPCYVLAAWRRDGAREALRRGLVALATFGAVNVPFVLADAGAYVSSVLAPAVEPLEPHGVGLVRLGMNGVIPLLPRPAYAALAALAFALVLVLVAARWRALSRGAVTFPLVPLYFAWRSLASYFVILPVFAAVAEASPALSPSAATSSPRAAGHASLSRQRADPEVGMPVDKELLEILACPVDKEPVREEGDRLVCTKCGRRYPVRDGIPVMLVEEAEPPTA